MSSLYVVDEIKNFIETNLPSENLVDLSGQFEYMRDMLGKYGLNHTDSWLGVQFVGSDEIPVSLSANNSTGCYREVGVIYLHIVCPSQKIGIGTNPIRVRAEAIRNLFRGQRIGNDIIINSVTPPNFEAGGTLDFEGGYTSASVLVSYQRDLTL